MHLAAILTVHTEGLTLPGYTAVKEGLPSPLQLDAPHSLRQIHQVRVFLDGIGAVGLLPVVKLHGLVRGHGEAGRFSIHLPLVHRILSLLGAQQQAIPVGIGLAGGEDRIEHSEHQHHSRHQNQNTLLISIQLSQTLHSHTYLSRFSLS